ncbi:hypothetical protein [Amycolatopsis tolypomycina]|uniref:hypothetical protein n=1 Tax=Amycolatopsis tolypomycina TaxID=208445 RepID=UPI0033B3D4BE
MVAALSTVAPGWLTLGATALLWMIVVGFATGILQYRTAHLRRTTMVRQYGPHLSERHHDTEVNPPLRTGFTPVVRLQSEKIPGIEGSLRGTRTGAPGRWTGTFSGDAHVVAKLFQLQLPPEYVPCWLHFLR